MRTATVNIGLWNFIVRRPCAKTKYGKIGQTNATVWFSSCSPLANLFPLGEFPSVVDLSEPVNQSRTYLQLADKQNCKEWTIFKKMISKAALATTVALMAVATAADGRRCHRTGRYGPQVSILLITCRIN